MAKAGWCILSGFGGLHTATRTGTGQGKQLTIQCDRPTQFSENQQNANHQ